MDFSISVISDLQLPWNGQDMENEEVNLGMIIREARRQLTFLGVHSHVPQMHVPALLHTDPVDVFLKA